MNAQGEGATISPDFCLRLRSAGGLMRSDEHGADECVDGAVAFVCG